MSFLYPAVLWLLIPLLILFFKYSKSILVKTHLIILILLIVTLSRPVQKEAAQEVNVEAKEIIIALDVSYSMQANDLSPSRYVFAKKTIKTLLSDNTSDNIMLIAFTTNPLLLSPPSTDHALISTALDTLNPTYILTKGTSLKKLFTKLSSFHSAHKNLILITDGGEEHEVQPLASLLQNADISLITLALGTTQGSTISKKDGDLLKTKEGHLVISRINPLLEQLTKHVKGTYLTASLDPKSTAEALKRALQNTKEASQHIQKMQHHYLELYQIPLLLATLLFLLVHTRAVKYLLIFFALFDFHAQASIFDTYYLHQAYKTYQTKDFNATQRYLHTIEVPSLQSRMALANTYYKTHHFKKAIQAYTSIRSTSAPLKQQLYYNIANAYAQLGSYSKAKIYYTKALQLGEDEDVKHNLKLVVLLADKASASLGMAHPKSQGASTSKSELQEADNEKSKKEDQPSSGSGSGGENKSKSKPEKNKQKENKLISDSAVQKQPLSSKVYDLINKGYIRETQPW